MNMPLTLDALLVQACARILTPAEQCLLCSTAVSEGKQQDVVLKLMMSGTAAGRTNLASANTLTARHAPKRHDRTEALQERRNHRARQTHDGRAAGLAFTITHHALERYAERHLVGQTLEAAMAYLTTEAVTATPMRARTMTGEQQWVGQSGILFVMRRDGGGALPVCVTILPREEDKTVGHRTREGKPLR